MPNIVFNIFPIFFHRISDFLNSLCDFLQFHICVFPINLIHLLGTSKLIYVSPDNLKIHVNPYSRFPITVDAPVLGSPGSSWPFLGTPALEVCIRTSVDCFSLCGVLFMLVNMPMQSLHNSTIVSEPTATSVTYSYC